MMNGSGASAVISSVLNTRDSQATASGMLLHSSKVTRQKMCHEEHVCRCKTGESSRCRDLFVLADETICKSKKFTAGSEYMEVSTTSRSRR